MEGESKMNQIFVNYDINRERTTREALKALRANVQFCGTDVHCIVITSCLPGDGKSTTSMGLSLALAQVGKKILLVDADLRKSTMLKTYTDAVGVLGFSEFLSGLASFDDVKCNTQFGNLDIIFCGQYPANPAELLSSSAFKSFVEEQKSKYDYIIIDTPPLGLVIDAAIVAQKCDGAIIVIAKDHVRLSQAKSVKDQIEKSGCKIIGTIINEVAQKKHTIMDKYYYKKRTLCQ